MRGMNRAWKGALLLAVVAAPWLAGLSAPFLYDDIGMLAENAFLEQPANLGLVLTGRTLADPEVVNGRRPAVLATYFADRALFGLRPAGWRVTSLLLHLGCAALLTGLLWRLTGRAFLAAAAGVLFGLHPALSEAVHAPGFRADVLCLFFVLAALHGFLSARKRAAIFCIGGAVGLVLALLSKETALAAPILLGALMFLFPAARASPVWRFARGSRRGSSPCGRRFRRTCRRRAGRGTANRCGFPRRCFRCPRCGRAPCACCWCRGR